MTLNDGLVAYWPLNGDFTDSIGALDGTSSNVNFVSGLDMQVANFDASTDRVLIPNTDIISGTDDFTLSFRIKYTSGTFIISRRGTSPATEHYPPDWQVYVSGGRLYMRIRTGGTYGDIATSGATFTGGYDHVVITRQSITTWKIYLNGALWGTSNSSISILTGDQLSLGTPAGGTGDSAIMGLGQLGVWSRALSEAEVVTLVGLVAYPFAIRTPINISIGGVNRASVVNPNSVSLSRIKTSQSSSLSFDIIRSSAGDYKPAVNDEVSITDTDIDSTVLFAGRIVKITETVNGGVEVVSCSCQDYTFDMDRRMVKQVYEAMTVDEIINDINDTLLIGFTTTGVDCPIEIAHITFNYEQPSKCFQQLADLVGYEWYVDDAKDIHFFSRETEVAPFGLTDTNGKYYFDSLKITRDIKNVRNRITVRGGTFQGATFTESTVADGTQVTFLQAYGYSNIAVTVAGAPKTVGIDNMDNAADFDCLYNFQEKSIKFPSATKPTASQVVAVTGNPHLPVIVSKSDSASIAEFGVRESKIVDNTINTKAGARERAAAELVSYANTLNEGQFETKESGLDVGQVINIQSDLRVLNEDFIISRITSRIVNPLEWRHTVTLVTTKTFGIIDFLQQLLMRNDKEIRIDSNEFIDNQIILVDTMTFGDSVGTPTHTHAPYRYGPGTNVGKYNFATYG